MASIDPGLDGGIAVLSEDGVLDTAVLPLRQASLGRMLDVPALLLWVTERDATEAVIERAQPMPDQGITGAFNYGMAFGQAIAAVQHLPISFVHPLRWKNAFGLAKKKGEPKIGKDASRLMAIELFPACADQFKRKSVDGHRAEAALLALYTLEGGKRKPAPVGTDDSGAGSSGPTVGRWRGPTQSERLKGASSRIAVLLK